MIACDPDPAILSDVPEAKAKPKKRERRSRAGDKRYAPKTRRPITKLGFQRIHEPEAWESAVREAMVEAQGWIDEAARALGVSRPVLFRWLADLEKRGATGIPRRPRGRPPKARKQ